MMVTTQAPPAAPPQTQPRTAASAALAWLEVGHWTEAAYFALPDTNYIVELSEGHLLVHEMPGLEHQRIVSRLLFSLSEWARTGGDGEVFPAPMPIRLWEGKIREPDITFYAAGHEDRYHVQYADPPDLAIEVLSPSTRRIDRQEKAAEYAEAGVTEYWIVDPEGRSIEVLTGAGPEGYVSRRQFGPGDEVTSAVLPGLVVSVAALLPAESPLNELHSRQG